MIEKGLNVEEEKTVSIYTISVHKNTTVIH